MLQEPVEKSTCVALKMDRSTAARRPGPERYLDRVGAAGIVDQYASIRCVVVTVACGWFPC
jgi:hypothetical protein